MIILKFRETKKTIKIPLRRTFSAWLLRRQWKQKNSKILKLLPQVEIITTPSADNMKKTKRTKRTKKKRNAFELVTQISLMQPQQFKHLKKGKSKSKTPAIFLYNSIIVPSLQFL